ncbi:MAG: FAD-dependent oxidoreductase [Bdellovibrionales bacterium]|nr:FAD-dependent oxidoreductase [Bdellovibrionales bacterium]
MPDLKRIETDCCIAGGGPAGMMLGLLLARKGANVVVLEKHADFLRDFRGDTIHPSTLELMHELGVLEEFLKRPHQEARQISASVGGEMIPVADFSHLPTHCKYIAFMPQWDFLNFIAEQGRKYSCFNLHMQSKVVDLLHENGQICGVKAETPEGPLEVHAQLTVGADGRTSIVRERAELKVNNIGAPIDVLWMKLPRSESDPDQPMGHFDRGRIFIAIYRGDYWQCGFVIRKGSLDIIKSRGLDSFRRDIAAIVPFMANRLETLSSWDDIKLLTVSVDRLKCWHRAGLLCIGDAAHAMSPVGGVGINLAIQDAVAAANLLHAPLLSGNVSEADLAKVQQRRKFPTAATQRIQVLVQNKIIGEVIGDDSSLTPPWQLKLLKRFPILRRLPARLIGLGFRAEHIN